MSINIWTDSMQHAALLGKPVLFTNWLIQRDIIPDGWYCYDLRGTHKSPSTRTTLVDHAADYHAGTVLSPIPLKHEGTASRRVNGTFYLLGEEMTLEQFCEEHDLAYPQDNREFVLRPASLDEVGLFYSEEKLDEALGTVGHLRMDFGHGEKEFWHTWWPHNEDRFNTPEFKEVLQRFVDDLRQTGLLKNLGAMDAYCWQHGGSITEDRRSYGYIAETENYRFCLRCTPFPGEYQGYLYCYDLCQQEMYRQEHPVVGRVTFASGEQQEFTDSKALLQAIREELPFRSTTGFRFETLTDDPEVKKAVDDILLDFAGEDNSRRTCNYGLTETGKQALTPPPAESGDDQKPGDNVTVNPETPDASTNTDDGNGADFTGTEQTIQPDPVKPEYTEDELKDPTKTPDGTPVEGTPEPQDHNNVTPPPEQPSTNTSGGLPGFDNVPNAGANQGGSIDSDGDINTQVGIMG